ncbi:hypothetical protein BJX76DRAFT_115102 [Aspergillus varians]
MPALFWLCSSHQATPASSLQLRQSRLDYSTLLKQLWTVVSASKSLAWNQLVVRRQARIVATCHNLRRASEVPSSAARQSARARSARAAAASTAC